MPTLNDANSRQRQLVTTLPIVFIKGDLQSLSLGFGFTSPNFGSRGKLSLALHLDKEGKGNYREGFRLNDIESLKLFQWHAFGRNFYSRKYHETLSETVAWYAVGNPLAFKVLGSFLHSKSEEEWESAVEYLKRVPNSDILKMLKISYMGLDGARIKSIFLDIACFFETPLNREYAESILNDGDSSAKIGISILIERSLLEISHKENYFKMHDLIRQMGRSIVSYEQKEPGNHSRLFDVNDVCHILEKKYGKLRSAILSKMCNQRFLKFYCDNIDSNKFKLNLPRGLESLVSNELRYFQWAGVFGIFAFRFYSRKSC
ncbi:hypothetical protein FNV43_RR00506 [Rhamnella rubrinervis]|uniref:Disease resistance protein Roq1-like winged-helix domain-containing protein n=1 Tax=Rhamnella rubrinervis TaxID=2594499 RepID=A0A8K0HQS7_9ROSA|nr:hypothetical protein FNV43_RR00506 [Rhamnella rubrinervis]